jgi:hypothetical protein
MVDMTDSKSVGASRGGSSPPAGTTETDTINNRFRVKYPQNNVYTLMSLQLFSNTPNHPLYGLNSRYIRL